MLTDKNKWNSFSIITRIRATKTPLADAEAMVEGGNPGCGDIVKVYLKIEDGHIVAVL